MTAEEGPRPPTTAGSHKEPNPDGGLRTEVTVCRKGRHVSTDKGEEKGTFLNRNLKLGWD